MRSKCCFGVLTVVGLMASAGAVFAQNPVTQAQNKLLAKRAAEADAYRKLAEAVYGVQLTSDTFVKDFVTESDTIKTAVDAFIKGIRVGTPRYYEDGVAEVDAEVTVAKLVTSLKEVHTAHYKGNVVKTTDIETISQKIKTDVIKVTGTGAPRPELPPDLPPGIESVIEPLPKDYAPPPVIPVPGIWKTVGPQARLMAQRAARLDAARKLLEEIKGMRLTSDTLVRDFITENDTIETHASGIVMGANETNTFLHDDELIAEVTMSVPVEKVIERIQELHTQHYKGNKITTTDITNVKRSIQREFIEATGSGVPPAKFLQQVQTPGFEVPKWMPEMLDATGECAIDPAQPPAQGKLMGQRCARADALRKLLERIQGLEIRSGTLVRDFITQNDQIMTQVQGVIADAVEDDVTCDASTCRVKMSVQASGVWSVVHSQMEIIQRHGGK